MAPTATLPTPIQTVPHTDKTTVTALESAKKGHRYLIKNARQFVSESETGLSWKDNFLDAMLLEITGNWNLVSLPIPTGKWNYFGGKSCSLTTDPYPEDIDTNALMPTIIKPADSVTHALMDEMLAYETVDGIIPTYYDSSRVRICPGVSANVCSLFYTYGRGHEVQRSLAYVYSTVAKRAWSNFHYYAHPEPLFWYCFRLIKIAPQAPELRSLAAVLKEAVTERVGKEALQNPVVLAMRLLICQFLGVANEVDLEVLLKLQGNDGAWDGGWVFCFGKTKIQIQNKGFTTGMAVEAIKAILGLDVCGPFASCFVGQKDGLKNGNGRV